MTAKQKQCLLAYLGYYTGQVDGIWGPLSEKAAEQFLGGREDKLLEESLKLAVAEEKRENRSFWEEIRYFRRQEFGCKCGKCGAFPAEPDRKLAELCDGVREHFGLPMLLSSAVRCASHNARVGGVANSRHLLGKAVDFCIPGKTAQQILAVVRADARCRYAYAIDGSYVHMDVA